LIKITNLTKHFDSNKAVDDISLEIAEGEMFGLLGPNGAGKTTTVNLAVGLLKPDSGHIELPNGGSPSVAKDRLQIGVATQALALYDDLTADENLRFFGKMSGVNGKDLEERVEWAFDFVSLTNRRKDKLSTYSGGMKRRLNLACAILHDPKLLFLDEPTVGVDPQSRNAIFEQIKKLNEEGKTIIYITHYMEEAEQLCDRVAIIDGGKIHALDTVENLINEYGGKPIVTVRNNGKSEQFETDDPIEKLTQLKESKIEGRISIEYPSLERVFLNLTGRNLRD
jgi:linearmycin/streptolysin S transport system ATP-binding protein